MDDPLYIGNEMVQFDRKNRDFYDSLTPEQQKKFSPYLMVRWGSLVAGGADYQAYYIMSCNERLNKNFFEINTTQHKKLQWLVATTVSPDMGTFKHPWIGLPKKAASNTRAAKFLREIYPHLQDDEIDLMSEINDKDDFKRLARDHGWSDERIKKEL
jgi:hypothetical protein